MNLVYVYEQLIKNLNINVTGAVAYCSSVKRSNKTKMV
jgi:hypothetical protein